jgi:TonB family protein
MNRLQKKCAIATAGIHLLLLLVLVFGSAFFSPRPKPDDTQLLDVIPANLVDVALNSGVRGATPPPPAPIVTPPPQPVPPAPAVQPTPPPPAPKPVVTPTPTIPEKLAQFFEPKPKPAKPTPETPEPKPHQIQPNLTQVTRVAPKNPTTPDNPRRDTLAISAAIRNLQKNLSPGTTIDMPGESTVTYANYASVVKSIYDQAWTLPDSIANDDENVKVTVTIARDGTVISSHIIEKAGDAPVDNSVQRTLDRVSFIAPFPDGATDKQRTYTINFNPKAKRTLE